VVGDALDDRRCAIAAMIFSSLPQFGQYSRSISNTCASDRAELMLARLLKRLSAAGGDRQVMAGKNRPADGFDGQVSVTEQPFERR
jgi:hypothetical protein